MDILKMIYTNSNTSDPMRTSTNYLDSCPRYVLLSNLVTGMVCAAFLCVCYSSTSITSEEVTIYIVAATT